MAKNLIFVDAGTRYNVEDASSAIRLSDRKVSIESVETIVVWLLVDSTDTLASFVVDTSLVKYTLTSDVLTEEPTLTLSNTSITSSVAGKLCYQMIFGLTSTSALDRLDSISIRFVLNSVQHTHTFSVSTQFVEVSDKYLSILRQMNLLPSEDFYTALFSAYPKDFTPDAVRQNDLHKELVLRYFEIEGSIGSYRSLLAVLDTFGYGALLRLRELWNSLDGTKSLATDLTYQIRDYLDHRLNGFQKSNKLQLVYSINALDGTIGEDGCPNYVNVLYDTTTLYIKMLALRRVLETRFLPLNTHIVDIIGEFTACLAYATRLWINEHSTITVELNRSEPTDTALLSDRQHFYIQNYRVRLKDRLIPLNVDVLEPASSTDFTERLFVIDTVIYDIEQSNFDEFDFLTNYWSGDFALVILDHSEIDLSKYRFWSMSIWQDGVELAILPRQDIDTLVSNDTLTVGIRYVGELVVTYNLYDSYGGLSIVSTKSPITIEKPRPLFYTVKPIITKDWTLGGTRNGTTSLDRYSTYVTNGLTNRYPVIDSADATYDIMTFDPQSHSNTILKYYLTNLDLITFQEQLRQENQGQLRSYASMLFGGYRYTKIYLNVTSHTSVRLRLYEHLPWTEVSWIAGGTLLETIKNAITAIHASDTVFSSLFTAELVYYATDNEDVSSGVPRLLLAGKQPEFTSEKFYFDFDGTYEQEDVFIEGPLAAHTIIRSFTTGSTANLKVYQVSEDFYGSTRYLQEQLVYDESYTTSNIANLQTRLNTIKVDLALDMSTWLIGSDLHIFSRQNLRIEHTSIGRYELRVRNLIGHTFEYVKYGSEYLLGEPLTAYLSPTHKLQHGNIVWTLRNARTGVVVTSQTGNVFRYYPRLKGAYTLSCASYDTYYGNTIYERIGCFLVVDAYNKQSIELPYVNRIEFQDLPVGPTYPIDITGYYLVDDYGNWLVDGLGTTLTESDDE